MGNDIYYYYGKPGFDIIEDAGGFDRIVFAEGYYAASGWGSPYRQGNDLVYVSADSQSGFTVKDHFSDPNKSIEYFEFERSGYTTQVRNSDQPIGNSEYDETLVGTAGNDILTGASGENIRHDEFYGYTGNDTIDNSAGGKSWIEGGSGNDTIIGGQVQISLKAVMVRMSLQVARAMIPQF